MLHPKLRFPLILFALLAAIMLPPVLSAYAGIQKGQAELDAQNYAGAAASFERSARFLPWRADLWEQAGIASGMNGNPSQAITFLNRAPKLSEQGWLMLGTSYFNTGNIPLALEAYQHGVKSYDSAPLYAGLAYIYRQQKNWRAESDALKNQTRLDSEDAYAHYRLGLLLAVLEPENALPELMLASSLDPETDSAVQTLRAALNVSSIQADPSLKMQTIGRALGLVQEWELAIIAFDQAVTLNAENAEAWAWLGEAKQNNGQEGSAELDRALSLDDTSITIRALRGLYWERQKNYPQMLVEYTAAAEAEPENPAWQASVADAYAKNGDIISALAAYQHATELAPLDATYWRLLAVFCADNGVHIEDVGLPAAQKAAELAPDDPSVLDALGWSYLSSGRYANAEQTLLDVIAAYPNHFSARIHLALTYLSQGNRTSAYNELLYVRDTDADGSDGQFAAQLLEQYFP